MTDPKTDDDTLVEEAGADVTAESTDEPIDVDETGSDDTGSDEEPESEDEDEAGPPEGPGRTGVLTSKRVLVAVTFAVIAFLAAATFGVLWWTTTSGDEYRLAEARDEITTVAADGIEAYSAIDPKEWDGLRERRREISTPELFEAEDQYWQQFRDEASGSEGWEDFSVLAEVEQVAVHELNFHQGNAAVIAAMATTLTSGDIEEVTKVAVYAQLKRIDGVWKLDNIAPLP